VKIQASMLQIQKTPQESIAYAPETLGYGIHYKEQDPHPKYSVLAIFIKS